ncbi:alpha/beta-hydrolase [Karstenula rhodostoma CBS 690.94]|uniref:Alpha/beta-hydrolase n=1 Tax=Karstenula rhodostoma CBS 690.94 TaxID=1392251 RepID=A0A9P4UIH3_9PLEO|nr:alpha/beta-hydrolase [Karstenula rhodostoma CBS 690.94]
MGTNSGIPEGSYNFTRIDLCLGTRMSFGPFALQWRRPSPNPPPSSPLPEGITRSSIHTPSGPLELLTASPTTSAAYSDGEKPPLFFAHGAFGCAEQWLNYMQYFAAVGYPCYAISYRGHGKSWYPWFWRLYFTTRGTMVEDLTAGIKYVEALEAARRGAPGTKVVLIAHSAGGALSQYALSRNLFQVQGFCMFAAVPGFGSWGCYRFWALTAPIHFTYRGYHSRYLLATVKQVQDAFFTAETPVRHVQTFAKLLSPYESMLWPMQALNAFVTGPDVLSSITSWAHRRSVPSTSTSDRPMSESNQRLFILAAEKDVLCTPAILEDAAQRYRRAFKEMASNDLEGSNLKQDDMENRVRFRVVDGVAHHLQNHEEWGKGADEVRKWLEQL